MEVINGKTATFSMIEENILLVVLKEDSVIDLPEAEENYHLPLQLTKGKRFASLVDGSAFVTITSEAKEYASQPLMYENTIAQALVISSLATRLVASFLVAFHQRNKKVDMKVFNNRETALVWLKEKVKNDNAKENAANTIKTTF